MTARAPAKLEFNSVLGLKILDRIAAGQTIGEVLEDTSEEWPSRATFYRWLNRYPEFKVAYEVAMTTSATSFEEMALEIARALRDGGHKFTASQVSGMNYAMQQYRWSAERRNPGRYAARSSVANVVPITINTTVDLGGKGQTKTEDIYHIEAHMVQDAEEVPIPEGLIEVSDEPERGFAGNEGVISEPPPVLRGAARRRAAEKEAAKALAKANEPPPPPKPEPPAPAQPRVRKKSPAAIAATRARYAARKKP